MKQNITSRIALLNISRTIETTKTITITKKK